MSIKKIKVQSLDKSVSMVTGKVYNVSEPDANYLIKVKKAVKASESMEVGKIYDIPKSK